MTQTRQGTKCRRSKHGFCNGLFRDHIDGLCPDGRGTFLKHVPSATRLATSYRIDEAKLLNEILSRTLRGADVSSLIRSAVFSRLYERTASLAKRAERKDLLRKKL